MRVLVIEDEKSIVEAVALAFEFRWPGAEVVSAATGKAGVELVKKTAPDVVILDLNLPDFSGFEVLKKVRTFSNVPVIILTVRSEDEDVVKGLESGADDYIVKPFNYLNLLARVKSVLRRTEAIPQTTGKKFEPVNARVKVDFLNQRVKVDNRRVQLTPIEYKLLALLARHKGEVVAYERITHEIWDKDFAGETRNIRLFVRRLRKKLGDNPPGMITNQRGSGYMLQPGS